MIVRTYRKFFLMPAVMLVLCTSAQAATITATDCSRAAVGAAVGAAANGDAVVIPAGTCEWTSTLAVSKGISLMGQGVGVTIIRDGVPGGSGLLSVTLVATRFTRVSSIEFQPGSRASWGSAIVQVFGSNSDSRRFRLDHCKFSEMWGSTFHIDTVLGVIDHNTILIRNNFTAGVGYVKDSNWNGQIAGDGAFASPDQFGTDQFVFFEDNTITYMGTVQHVTLLDAQAGARYVFRYNAVAKGSLEGHGTESGNRERGTRAIEIYNNTFTGIGTQNFFGYFRGGVGLVHDNTISGYSTTANFALLSNRNTASFVPWGGADGTNPWDSNVPGGPFSSGTVSSVGGLTVTDNTKSWTTNQWAGYVLNRTSGGAATNMFSEIDSNTSNTITYKPAVQNGTLTFSAGQTYSIYKVNHTLDQPGRGQGSLVTGSTPVRPAGWNDQVTSPWYEWNNVREGGANVDFLPAHRTIRQNEHFFNNTVAPGYTPFAYPHPLTVGQNPPAPPLNVRITQ